MYDRASVLADRMFLSLCRRQSPPPPLPIGFRRAGAQRIVVAKATQRGGRNMLRASIAAAAWGAE